jgi:ferredoxin
MIPASPINHKTDDPTARIEHIIREFCRTSPENSLKNEQDDRAFDDPLIGFSGGADPLYEFLRQDIGSPCMTPIEIFRRSFPGTDACAEELTVISWVLPQTRLTKDANSRETTYPSERWARAKHYGGAFVRLLLEHVTGTLGDEGIDTVAPVLAPFWEIGMSGKYGLASTWSERHAAYVSGLGTFGLCDGLITQRGKAMVCGSVIARVTVPPTPRPYTDHHGWCLYYAKGTCGLCIKRCPAGALTKDGHNKDLCRNYCFGITQPYIREHFGIDNYGCGLCQTGVPCESVNPVRAPRAAGISGTPAREDRSTTHT